MNERELEQPDYNDDEPNYPALLKPFIDQQFLIEECGNGYVTYHAFHPAVKNISYSKVVIDMARNPKVTFRALRSFDDLRILNDAEFKVYSASGQVTAEWSPENENVFNARAFNGVNRGLLLSCS